MIPERLRKILGLSEQARESEGTIVRIVVNGNSCRLGRLQPITEELIQRLAKKSVAR